MGAVYLALSLREQRQVAVKLILREHLQDEETRGRFDREAAILRDITHQNVVSYYDSGDSASGPFLAMEYLQGRTLAERLTDGPLTITSGLTLAIDSVSGLGAAYRTGTIHRDIKPSNIFLTAVGSAKITDFGIAKRHAVDPALTKTGYIVGTPAYASPEQILGYKLGFHTDIYSLGIVLYEALAGRHPFDLTDGGRLLHQHIKDPLPPLNRDDAPPQLYTLLRQLTEKKPVLRGNSYDEIAAALIAIREQAQVRKPPKPRIVAPEAARIQFASLIGRCFCCGREYGQFRPDFRLCDSSECPSQQFSRRHPNLRKLFVSILPERQPTAPGLILPSILEGEDVFAHAPAGFTASLRDPAATSAAALPYCVDHLANLGLRCGRPLLYESQPAARWSGFDRVFVLDMSTYAWSHTLKDARSWAVINVALENGFNRFALYTAGNAGLSLARLAYEVNRLLPAGRKRLEVSLLVDESVTPAMKAALSTYGARIYAVRHDSRRLLDPDVIWLRLRRDDDTYVGNVPMGGWHVTDGWDGVGITMYRLIVAQVLQQLDVAYVVAPLGTGSLFLGAYLGVQDSLRTGRSIRMVGAVPAGENVLRICREPELPKQQASNSVMEKLVGRYSPLAPCISVLDRERADVHFVEVSPEMLQDAYRELFGVIACEPSAASAFAALRGNDDTKGVIDLAQVQEDASHPRELYYQSPSSVLVINSGFGLLTTREGEFLAQYVQTGQA
jgi:serine/threonine protein kinase/threonine synthase